MFRVLTPSGIQAEGQWDRLRDIPDRINDSNGVFETQTAEVVVMCSGRAAILGVLCEVRKVIE